MIIKKILFAAPLAFGLAFAANVATAGSAANSVTGLKAATTTANVAAPILVQGGEGRGMRDGGGRGDGGGEGRGMREGGGRGDGGGDRGGMRGDRGGDRGDMRRGDGDRRDGARGDRGRYYGRYRGGRRFGGPFIVIAPFGSGDRCFRRCVRENSVSFCRRYARRYC